MPIQRKEYPVRVNWDDVEINYFFYSESCSLLETTENPGLKEIRRTLELSHQSGKVKSIYSNVFNLTDKVIHNYYLYDYREPFLIDLNDTENLPLKPILFSSLFPGRMEAVGLD